MAWVLAADFLCLAIVGIAMAAMTIMMDITTSTSVREKPCDTGRRRQPAGGDLTAAA
jgi:hypothetical protein